MPIWGDNTVHASNLPDRELAIRTELTTSTANLSSVLANGNDAGAQKIVNLGAPTANTDAATKTYVDGKIGGPSGATAQFSQAGVLQVGTGVGRFLLPFPVTIDGVVMAVNTAPTGASLICDVNKNGTTIFTTQANRPTIAAGAFAVTTQPSPDVTTATTYDYITVDIDQVGSTVAGADLIVVVRYTRTA